ncbi:hypothetical protein [Aurantiacibacter hainanensis]|uniref:hypothetical protein n=1 Tax=Aurantiacibacter hainanensis TaxID=3076114 RepID=UPI0030C69B0B
MTKSSQSDADQTKPAPKIDPATPPLGARELAQDEGAQDRDAWHGARDLHGVQKDRTHPDEIDIERGDTLNPGDTPEEVPAAVPDEEILPPD